MEETGIVVAVTPDHITLEVIPEAECGSCMGAGSCHPGDGARRRLTARDPLGVGVGNRVVVAIPEAGLWRALALAYGVPLVLMFGGAGGGYALARTVGAETAVDLVAAVGAVAGLVGGFVLLRRTRHRYEPLLTVEPVVVRVLPSQAGLAPLNG